ncbi:hypothetical protein OC842_006263 [Tilletia horrida]|uniref:AB hydrolase-1 domain-containing protein n=1 Tax=Tilletia horrida TaxID=155126 RepID=A0AAN6JI51_9BASI|nr:hypothetical protein OC842_006263 [Tilletia horrida]
MRFSSAGVRLIAGSLGIFVLACAAQQQQAAAAAVACSSTITTVQGSVRSYQRVASPSVPHSPQWGWTRLAYGNSEVCLANLLRDVTLFPNSQATVPIYESNDVNRQTVTRLVLGVQALGADSWHYWSNLANTRNKAWGNNAAFDKSKVSVIVPQFIRQADKDAGAATPTDLWFGPDDYGYGGYALGPASVGASAYSTLDVLDALIRWIEARYPNVQRIVLVGHSLGAQLIQRYGLLRRDGQGTRARLDYVIMNAGSYAYPLPARPMAVDVAKCPNYDTWPFGFAVASAVPRYAATDLARLGRKGLTTRFAGRNVHILLGSEDYASGTTKCEALVQGSYHLSRGRFYATAIVNATGTQAAYNAAGGNTRFKSSVGRGQAGLPAPWTYDIVSGCAHVQECMYQSDAGVKRLMLDGYASSASSSSSSSRRRRARSPRDFATAEQDREEEEEEEEA